MKYVFLSAALFCAISLHAATQSDGAESSVTNGGRIGEQELEALLDEIAGNNLGLQAIAGRNEAAADANLSVSALPDPDLEFAYLFGTDNVRRYDFSLSQSFDFGALSGRRRKSAFTQNELLELEYRSSRREIVTAARKLICEIVYRNALIEEYRLRAENAASVEQSYRSGFEKGEFSVIDYRKAAVSLAEAQGQLDLMTVERDALLAELKTMNGGLEINIAATDMSLPLLPDSFDEWLDEAAEKNSALNYVRSASSLSELQLKLARSEALPSLSIGYMAEIVPGSEFRGVSLGLSLPLWSSSKKISGAKKELEAARTAEQQALIEFRTSAEALYAKVLALASSAASYELAMNSDDGLDELRTALDAGQISLLDYITELGYYYSAKELALQAKLQHALAMAELLALEM